MLTEKGYDGCGVRSNKKSAPIALRLSQRPQVSSDVASLRVTHPRLRHLSSVENRVWRLDPAHHVFRRILQVSRDVRLARQVFKRWRHFSRRTLNARNTMAPATPISLNEKCYPPHPSSYLREEML